MSTKHDPLCPDQGAPNGGWLLCDFCDLIERVRADEREQAWIRVLKLCGHTKYVGCEPCIHDECAEAARGEAS